MANASQQLALVIAAIDETSGPIAAVAKKFSDLGKQVKALNEPPKQTGVLGGIGNKVKGLGQMGRDLVKSSGIGEFAATLGKVKAAAVEAASGVASIVTPLAGLSALATIGGIGELLGRFASHGTEIARTSDMLGVTVRQLQELQGAAQVAGIPVDAVNSSLAGLMQTMRRSTFDATTQALFRQVGALSGVSIQLRNADGSFRTTADVLGQVANALSKVRDPGARMELAQKLGISPAMLTLLNRGTEGLNAYIDAARRAGLVLSDADIARAQELDQSVRLLGANVTGLGYSIAGVLAPVLGPVIHDMAEWVTANRDWIATNIQSAIEGVRDTLKGIDWTAVGEDVRWLYGEIGGLKGVMIAVAAIMAAPVVSAIAGVATAFLSLGAVVLANPILLSIAAIAAGAVLIYENWDDLVGHFKGVFSGIEAAFQDGWVHGVLAVLVQLSPLTLIEDMLQGISQAVFGFDLSAATGRMIGTILGPLNSLADKVNAIAEPIKEGLLNLFSNLATGIDAVMKSIPVYLDAAITKIRLVVADIMAVIQPAIDAAKWVKDQAVSAGNAVGRGVSSLGNAMVHPLALADGSTMITDPASGMPIVLPPDTAPSPGKPAAQGGKGQPSSITVQAPVVTVKPLGGSDNSPVSTPMSGGGAAPVATPYTPGVGSSLGPAPNHQNNQTQTHVVIDVNAPPGTTANVDRSAGPGQTSLNIQYSLQH